jgi:hypothetical protein
VTKTTLFNWKKSLSKKEKTDCFVKREYETFGNHLSSDVVDLILKLRSVHKLGTWRIKWYMERYHDNNISESGVYRTLKRHNIERLDRKDYETGNAHSAIL